MRLMDKLFEAAKTAVEVASKVVGDHVRLDAATKRVFVSDTVVRKAVELAAGGVEDLKLLAFERAPEGYSCTVQAGSRVVRATVRVTSVVFHGEAVSVFVDTPEPVEVVDRPVITFMVKAIAQVFGGTAVGGWLLSVPLPSGATWDGSTASFVFGLSDAFPAPAWAKKTPVAALVDQDAVGLWLRFADENGQPVMLLELICSAVLPLLR